MDHNLFLYHFNHTFITLISKVSNPTSCSDYRPISFWNVSYKTVAKVLANELKMLTHSVIEEEQTYFLQGQLIFDNINTRFWCFSLASTSLEDPVATHGGQNWTSTRPMIMWNDISWRTWWLRCFPSIFVNIIFRCVQSVELQILLNDAPIIPFFLQWGICQGKPLSSLLFLVCVENLSGLIGTQARSSLWKAISMCRGVLVLTHLLFADDSLLFL